MLWFNLQKRRRNSFIGWADDHPIQTFIDNALRLNSAGNEAIHSALRALLACSKINPGSIQHFQVAVAHQLSLDDIENSELAELTRSLAALFEDLDRYLFRSAEGAGSAICVAIGVLYIVFIVLEKVRRVLHFSMLSETGVERVLQALFGLLSMAYRNTGILDVLQEFSGRELSPRKFDKLIRMEEIQARISSQYHADAGEPSPDIIEALQELFSAPDSPCAEGVSASLGNTEASNRYSPYREPNTSSNPQGTQRLDPSRASF